MATNTTRPPRGPTQSPVGQTSSGAKAAQLMQSPLAKPGLASTVQGQPGVAVSRTKTNPYPAARSTTKPAPTQPGGGTVQRTTAVARPAPTQQTQTFKKGGKVKPPMKPKKR